MGFPQGKRALVTGIASARPITSGIAEAMHREGVELAFTYQNDQPQDAREESSPPNPAATSGSRWIWPMTTGSLPASNNVVSAGTVSTS